MLSSLAPVPFPPTRRGGISDVVENAQAMAARMDTTVKKTGTQKRDVDYIAEYLGFVREYEDAKKSAEAAGGAFDDSAILSKVKAQLEIASADAELDAGKKA
jgi:hypothetical protein